MTTLLFGMQFFPSCSSAFGEKRMLEASVVKREQARIYELVFSKPYLSGALLPLYPMSPTMQAFVLFFLVLDLLGVFSCINSFVLGLCPLRVWWISFTYKKV